MRKLNPDQRAARARARLDVAGRPSDRLGVAVDYLRAELAALPPHTADQLAAKAVEALLELADGAGQLRPAGTDSDVRISRARIHTPARVGNHTSRPDPAHRTSAHHDA